MDSQTTKREQVCALTIVEEQPGMDHVLGNWQTGCDPGILKRGGVEERNFQRQHLVEYDTERPDIVVAMLDELHRDMDRVPVYIFNAVNETDEKIWILL